MKSIRKWIRRKLKGFRYSGQSGSPAPDDPIFLDLEDQSPIIAKPTSDGMQNYGVFRLLPYELRRQILIEVFGAQRTLHLDLFHKYPPKRKRQDAFLLDSDHDHLYYGSVSSWGLNKAKPFRWIGLAASATAQDIANRTRSSSLAGPTSTGSARLISHTKTVVLNTYGMVTQTTRSAAAASSMSRRVKSVLSRAWAGSWHADKPILRQ
ncbi:hypothetical protein KJ359_001985 [Pestalotiopsis sp. 9143b]|nr:hypothetical protein KJ359_001985 [Pestalotiopsis sp. 9143b]